MIHTKIASPNRTPQSKKRPTNSARALVGSPKTKQRNAEIPPTEPVPVRYSGLYKREKAQAEMGTMFKRKRIYPIAPDAHIPNSTARTVFKRKEIKPVEMKAFQIRMDILNNLQKISNNRDGDDDDGWTEMDDPDASSKPASAKKSKGTVVSRSKASVPDLFKRLQDEPWWKQAKEDRPKLPSILPYLNEILKSRQSDSYESACYYIVEIFRTYGLEPASVDQILGILLEHVSISTNDPLGICTVRTISQFMIERKEIIVCLLECALKCQPNDTFRLEIINAVKFITDVNHSDGIELVLEHMSVVHDSPKEDFSLKIIIKELESQKKTATSDPVTEGEESSEIHPLLKKISEERWFPRDISSITLNHVLQAIVSKLPNSTKTLIKTLTTHLVQLHRVIGYIKEQFDAASHALISLLGHSDADYRLLAATNLANLGQETKAIDLALLNSFVNDARILVRTECCETLKKLTKITSETVLQDCVNDISHLETLPEDNFSLQNYLREKNRLPTPPPPPPPVATEEPTSPPSEEAEEEEEDEKEQGIPIIEVEPVPIHHQDEIKEDIIPRSLSPPIIEQPANTDDLQLPVQTESTQFSIAPSVSSTMTLIQPAIRVEINGKPNIPPAPMPRSRTERSPGQLTRSNKRSTSPAKTPPPEQMERKRSTLLPNNTNMWDSYDKQNEPLDSTKQTDEVPSNDFPVIKEESIYDPIQTIIDEHKQNVGFYRMVPSRRVLIPHKICMENILADQSHIMINRYSPPLPKHAMNLSDFNHNQQQLHETEFVQLLSSLVIRVIQVHKHYEKLIPGLNSPSFVTALSVSPAPLHSTSNFNSPSSPPKLPLIISQRPTTRQFARMQANMHAKAAKEGVNVRKAQHMEAVLSNLLKHNRESTKSTTISSTTSHFSSAKHIDVTHAWFLVHLLRSQGIFNSDYYLQKIIQTYPKFIPILNTRIPPNLLSIVWDDPVAQQLASIFRNRQDQTSRANSTMKRRSTKPSLVTTDDEYSVDDLDYTTLINHVESKKKFLPIVQGSKMNLPRHVLKFGFRDIDMISSEPSSFSLSGEGGLKSRKRRVYMHMMMPTNDNMSDRQETTRSQLQQMIRTNYSTTSYVPIVTRPPMCH